MAAALQQQSPVDTSLQQLHQLQQLDSQPIAPSERLHWMQVLRELCCDQSQPLILTHVNAINTLIALAERLCDWPMVIHLRQQLMPLVAYSDYAIDNQSGLAEAYHQQGRLSEAADCIRSCVLCHYQQSRLAQYYWQLQQELSSGPFSPDDLRGGELTLTPLTEYHLSSFCWAYADPSIGQLCNLPEFVDDQHWLHWLADNQAESNKGVFALMHQQWGFIGSLCLEVFNGIGFFYYWLGADFQGYGFGPQALDILLAAGAKRLDMRCCYAKAYQHNEASQKAMKKLGFVEQPFTFESPHDNEIMYYLGPYKPDQAMITELEYLFNAQDSYLRLTGLWLR